VRAQFFGISSRSNFFEHITFERSPQRCLTDVSVFHQSSTSFLFDRFHRIRIPRNDLLERSPQHYLIAFDRPSVFAKFPNSKYRLIDSQHEQRSPQYCLIAFDRPSVFAEFPISKELYSDPLINFLSNLKDSSRQPLSPNDFENVDYFK
jgi:hypothetical protein